MLDDVQAALREAILTIHDLRAEMTKLRAERDEREAALCVDIQEVYVERDRLRADIKRALPRLREAMRYVRVEQWPAVHNALDAMRDLEEALDLD